MQTLEELGGISRLAEIEHQPCPFVDGGIELRESRIVAGQPLVSGGGSGRLFQLRLQPGGRQQRIVAVLAAGVSFDHQIVHGQRRLRSGRVPARMRPRTRAASAAIASGGFFFEQVVERRSRLGQLSRLELAPAEIELAFRLVLGRSADGGQPFRQFRRPCRVVGVESGIGQPLRRGSDQGVPRVFFQQFGVTRFGLVDLFAAGMADGQRGRALLPRRRRRASPQGTLRAGPPPR